MNRIAAAACLWILAAGLARVSAQPAGEAAAKLQGTWTAVRAERDGNTAQDVVGNRLSFSGDRFRIDSSAGKTLYAGTVHVDASATPMAIDFAHTEGALAGKSWKGIYEIAGDTLTTCDNAPDLTKGRPASFEARRASGYVLINFRRSKR